MQLKRVFVKDDQWEIGNPYERLTDSLLPTNGSSVPYCTLQWEKNIVLPLPGLSHLLDSKQTNHPEKTVVLMIRTYTSETGPGPKHTSLKFRAVQHLSDFALFWGHLSADTFVGESTCNAEKKFISKPTLVHQRFYFKVDNPLSKPPHFDPTKFWLSTVLKPLWDKFILKEWGSEGRIKTCSPLSVTVEGVPNLNLNSQKLDFITYNGLPVQSSWYLFPHEKVFDEEWFIRTYEECLHVRGKTLDEFNLFCDHFFWEWPVQWSEELYDYQAMIVRACTLLQVTHPYVKDYRYNVNGHIVSADMFNVKMKTLFGDCEDGAMAAYFTYYYLLINMDWKTKEMQYLQKLAVMLGLPVGVSGLGRDPNYRVGGHDICHMYSVIIPFPMLHYALTGEEPPEEVITHITAKYGLNAKTMLSLRLQAGVMETTLMTTSFYHEREKDDRKTRARSMIQHILSSDVVEDQRLCWLNYTTPHPLSFTPGDSAGEVLHTHAYRFFTPPLEHFYPDSLVGGVDLKYQHSFIPYKPQQFRHELKCDDCHKVGCVKCKEGMFGVDASLLFQPYKSLKEMKWRMKPTTRVTKEVFDLSLLALRTFKRPLIPLHYQKTDPLKLDQLPETVRLEDELFATYSSEVVSGEKKDHRILLYCWRLFSGSGKQMSTDELVKKIQHKIGAEIVTLHHFGNGYAFIFHWLD